MEDFACIVPTLTFGGDMQDKAHEAMDYYKSVFDGVRDGIVQTRTEASGEAGVGSITYADFTLKDVWFAVMDTVAPQKEGFNEAVSYVVYCKDQAEIDYYWEKLSAHPENEQCGWCKDKYGVSWQIVPEGMEEWMRNHQAFKTLMGQKKIVIDEYSATNK